MFKQINTDWIVWPYHKIQPGRRIHNPLGEQGLNYSFVDKASTRALTHCLPAPLRSHARVLWVNMTGDFRVHAHRDTGAHTVINWYVSAGQGITRFYNDQGAEPIDTYQGHSVNCAYAHRSLTECAQFVAKDGECWILNTDCIHDVAVPQDCTRTFVSWGFRDLNYEEVQCHFE